MNWREIVEAELLVLGEEQDGETQARAGILVPMHL